MGPISYQPGHVSEPRNRRDTHVYSSLLFGHDSYVGHQTDAGRAGLYEPSIADGCQAFCDWKERLAARAPAVVLGDRGRDLFLLR